MTRMVYDIKEYNQMLIDVQNDVITSLILSSANFKIDSCPRGWNRRVPGDDSINQELRERNGFLYYPPLELTKRLDDLVELIATGVDGIDLSLIGKNLKVLYLNDCILTNSWRIESFHHLTRLVVEMCSDELPDIDFSSMKSLKYLELKFQTERKLDLNGCTSLETVRLKGVCFDSADWLPTENLQVIDLNTCTSFETSGIPLVTQRVMDLRNHSKLRMIQLEKTKVDCLITGRMVPDQTTKTLNIFARDLNKIILGDRTSLTIHGSLMPEIVCGGGSLVKLVIHVTKTHTDLELSEHFQLEELKICGLSGCKAIIGLEFCHKIRGIMVYGCKDLEHISPLGDLEHLRDVIFFGCPILNVPDLPAWVDYIRLCQVPLIDLRFMRKSQISEVNIIDCGLESLDDIVCDKLIRADFTKNKLKSTARLLAARKLRKLVITGNPVTDSECFHGRGIKLKE